MVDGNQAQYIGRIAERTFCDLLDTWVGPNYLCPARLDPDNQKIDICHQMPSLSNDLGNIPFSWQVKARKSSPREINSPYLKCRCYRLDVSKSYIEGIINIADQTPIFYLALAIMSVDDISSLPQIAPGQRFRWYVVNLKQYCSKLDRADIPSYIDIPVQNRLNLALFSLLWASNWVDRFFAPLRYGIPCKPKQINDLTESLKIKLPKLNASITSTLLNNAIPSIEQLKDVLSPKAYRDFAGPLTIIASLRNVNAMLIESNEASRIETYCPESLAGTASLWLFSTQYHEFMRITQKRSRENKRLLPLEDPLLTNTPKFFLATLFNVRQLYRCLGAKVELVHILQENGRNDYSYYSGLIGAFRWVQVDQKGHIFLSNSRLSAKDEDLDAIRTAEKCLITSEDDSLIIQGHFGGLTIPDLELEATKPNCLFPQEDHFLEHPWELWAPTLKPRW